MAKSPAPAKPKLNPAQHIRIIVFGMVQIEFAKMLGIAQSTLCDHEKNGYFTHEHEVVIRREAKRRKKPWNDSLFFEVPKA